MMTPGHVFIDSLGQRSARPEIERGWSAYFEMVPDYWVKVERTFEAGDTVVLLGSAGGTYAPRNGTLRAKNRWDVPAAWTVRVKGSKVDEWRIYADNEPMRAIIRRHERRS